MLDVDTRYQVFISSTYTDLREERQAVLSALLQLNAIPAGMELFPAADEDAWGLISRVIEECDYYLLLIGGRYGSLDSDGLSFTEREYDYATTQKKPVMAFLHGRPEDIPLGKSEKEPETREKLESFRKRVERAKHVKYWTSAEQLAGQVALTFASFVKSYPAVGWMRSDQVAASEALSELNSLRKENDELRKALNRTRTELPAGSENLAKGGETYTLAIESRFDLNGDLPKTEDGKSPARGQTRTFYLNVTWDEILKAVGPTLFDEATEENMRRAMVAGLLTERETEVDLDVIDWIKNEFPDYSGLGGDNYSGKISDQQFSTIIVQLKALGVIDRSRRSRSVNDRNTYWTLTPYGDAEVTRLVAIQSGEVKDDVEEMSTAQEVRPEST